MHERCKPKIIRALTATIEDQTADAAGKGFESTVSGLKDGMAQGDRRVSRTHRQR